VTSGQPQAGIERPGPHQTNGGNKTTPEQTVAAEHAAAIQTVADDLDDLQIDLPDDFHEPLELVEASLREAADAARHGIDEEHAIRFLMFENLGLDLAEIADREAEQ